MDRFNHYEHKRLKLMASFCRGQDVLDLGYAQLPNPYFDGLHRVGLDLNEPKCRHEDETDVDYEEKHLGNVLHIKEIFEGRQFDNIVAGEFIEHLENPYEFLRGLKPHLSDSGRLIISTPNPLSFPVLLVELFRNKRYFFTRDHRYYFCPRWVERILDLCGYELVAVKGVGLWNPIVHIPAPVSLSYQVIYVASKRK